MARNPPRRGLRPNKGSVARFGRHQRKLLTRVAGRLVTRRMPGHAARARSAGNLGACSILYLDGTVHDRCVCHVHQARFEALDGELGGARCTDSWDARFLIPDPPTATSTEGVVPAEVDVPTRPRGPHALPVTSPGPEFPRSPVTSDYRRGEDG